MRKILVEFVSETLATAFLLFFGCMGVCTNPKWADFVFGLVVMTVIQCFGHISGAFINPSVTLCAYLLRKISSLQLVVLTLAQVLGACIGFVALQVTLDVKEPFCMTLPAAHLSPVQSFTIEFAITAVLALFCCAVWDTANAQNQDSVPLKFGFLITSISLACGTLTGASMNPARSFAPALFYNDWRHHWVYWSAPMLASLLASVIYRKFFMTKVYILGTNINMESK